MMVRTLWRQVPRQLVPRQKLRDGIVAGALAHRRPAFRGRNRELGGHEYYKSRTKDAGGY